MYITQYTHALFNITINLAEDVICNKHIKLKFYSYDRLQYILLSEVR